METLQFSFFLRLAAIALAVGVIFLSKIRKTSGSSSVIALAGIIAAWSLLYLIRGLNESYISHDVLISANYLFLSLAASLQLIFSFSYANRPRWLTPPILSLYLIEPVLIQVLFWAQPLRLILFNPQMRVWELINLIYISHLLAASIFLFMDTFLNKPRSHFLNAGTILLGSILPMLGNLMLLFTPGELENRVHIVIFSYALASVGFAYGKFNHRLIEAMPVTRDIVVESMDDGWMVVDGHGKVIDLNSSAENMIGMSRDKIYGFPVEQILTDWKKVLQSPEGIKEMEMRRTVKAQDDGRYLNIRISQLMNKDDSPLGHLVVWRDITERKLSDEARQRARDELFVLLNAISSLASSSLKLEDFLDDSSYQIVYSFHSQAVAIFLTEENEGSPQTLSLKSHFGIPADRVETINGRSFIDGIHRWLVQNEQNRPLLLEQNKHQFNVPLNPADIGFNYAALIPLVIYTQHENNILGCLCLGRNDDPAYTQDEIIRLTTIANQISTLIESDRRRQFAITLKERQRIMRDLHDSVSQKLYGLVALTEAVQAAIEVGAAISLVDVLVRIGENARQAVKEMRLFLYEMQPPDLKDGIVSTLQHRLSAVEGRADIKARMTSDENIQLEKSREIALYHIAQEALNNILRHAHAKNVTVDLRQNRRQVTLEIIDDGQGFDIEKADKAGMGLRNMEERARNANGKFTITSEIGKGTHITVSVARKN